MPSHPPDSQLNGARPGPTPGWMQSGAGPRLVADVQRMAIPELTRVFGQYGLYLRPNSSISSDLSGNMLGQTISLHREGAILGGRVRCLDTELPFDSGSLALVYALFMLESSPDPDALMREIARVLKPDGSALMISLNPLGLARLRWLWRPMAAASGTRVERMARSAGLEVLRRQYLGPFWPGTSSSISDPGGIGWKDSLRAANLVVLRRRDSALTPLRKTAAAVRLRPGMSAG